MSNHLIPAGGNSPSPFSPQGRALSRRAREMRAETALAALQARGVQAVTDLGMEVLADLDDKRRQEAGNNQGLNQLLVELELAAARKIGRVVNNLYNNLDW
jgi:hypothetical protein